MPGVSQAALSRFAARARRAAKLTGEVSILITGSDEIRALNRQFRRKDKPTDVLSFPSEAPGIAGDIAISAEIAHENGERLGHGTLTELKILMLHGVLHLAGFDHETDDGKMARKEAALRRELGLQDGLIERATFGAANGKRAMKPTKTTRSKR